MKAITTEDFLSAIWPKELMRDETLELRVIRRKDNSIRRNFLKTIPQFIEKAKEYEGWDIYFGVSTRFQEGGKKKDCFRAKTVWVDLDRRQMPDFDTVPPNMLVSSGSGLHIYWVLESPVFIRNTRWQEVEAVNRALCKKFNGDIAAIDVSRILRVPGFYNYKYDPPRKVQAYVSS